MGQDCSIICPSTDKVPMTTVPDEGPNIRNRRSTTTPYSTNLYQEEVDVADSDSDYDLDGTEHGQFGEDSDHEATLQHAHSIASRHKALLGFKEAVQNGNESLVMYYIQEFPEMDLLQSTTFETGDNCLQIAVRNKSYNLILYLLTNGISVECIPEQTYNFADFV